MTYYVIYFVLKQSLPLVPSMIFGCKKGPVVGDSVFESRPNNLWTDDDLILGEGVLRQSKMAKYRQ